MSQHKTNPVALASNGRPKCETCVHGLFPDAGNGVCRFGPPSVFHDIAMPKVMGQPPQITVTSNWPPVARETWCGQHPDYMRWFLGHQRTAEGLGQAMPEGQA
jgi:hypothetical protein